ncbi:probable aminopeptidase NPEPL1 isoform X2 [Amphibalanus amphitrite]|nr:probable aminopeptidase NPEPL1 isoform X2 [Amphibalanus amphitrite]XP_043233601.1 probable aminopeptidase NPEPL1 isoform X2 [Amphibalanus amphitrite]XP_043233603.1 probable aminopeptidase NPEPL1 isoform X2 [Amphibalanus amphitrite]
MATLKYAVGLAPSDPDSQPVMVLGQIRHLARVSWDTIKVKLEPQVSEAVWQRAVSELFPSPTDSLHLYLNQATLAALPGKCSRHNTPSRAHSVTRLVRSLLTGADQTVVLVCERADMLATGCAVARALPLFTRKSGPQPEPTITVEVLVVDGEQASAEEVQLMQDAARGIRLTARLVDTPANEMHTDAFVEEVKKVGEELGVSLTLIRGEDLKARGFGGIYGVGKAAVHPPALAILSHTPAGATQSIAWVGKGIVYDTGGLSMKTKTTMPGMKRDLGGAAAILGAFLVTVKAGFTQNLHAVFCLAENAVGPIATKPDDIHTLYSGRTVEINNTDAEGRLVLADGVAYANKDLKCTTILDMATLTGAQGTATGKYHGALLTNEDTWEVLGAAAGRASGDLLFPVPYTPELHFSEFASSVADMKNSAADRSNALVSCAGLFIAANLGFDFPGSWIHVDMASPVHSGDRATGYGVALLCVLFGAHSSHRLLQAVAPPLPPPAGHTDGTNSSKKMRLEQRRP